MSRIRLLLLSCLLSLSLLIAAGTAEAQVGSERRFGLGLALGYPDVGLSAQYFLSPETSLQFTLAFWYQDGRVGNRYNGYRSNGVFLRADYLFHPNVLIDGAGANLGWFIGPGAYVAFGNGNNAALGAEMPVGLDVRLDEVPLAFALELVPRLGFVDSSGVYLNFGIGGTLHARYFF